jgi:hypothetical protein
VSGARSRFGPPRQSCRQCGDLALADGRAAARTGRRATV